jgi:very-short-patch-repair endonuclease
MGAMAPESVHRLGSEVWALARRQHGVVSRRQLRELGLSEDAIKHRLAIGRLHALFQGVYAIGRPEISVHGRWMAAVLRCGPGAVLSHMSAAMAWGIRPLRPSPTEISVPMNVRPRAPTLRVHRRTCIAGRDVRALDGIPITSPALTLVDLAARLHTGQLEAAINEADKQDLISPGGLLREMSAMPRRPGIAPLRRMLDRDTFVLTDSELERHFLPIARAAGLPAPVTGKRLNGFKVDFYWPDLGLAVETDGLRYHRTPTQQAQDRRRDQAHTRAGLTTLRFTHAQVSYEPGYVSETLAEVATRLTARRAA